MFKRSLLFALAFVFLVASQGMAADLGIQFGSKWSSLGGHPTTIGLKAVEDAYSFTARAGLYRYDMETRADEENVYWVTLGGTFDYYLDPGEELRPYVGGDVDIHFYDIDDSETALSLVPHFGVEYWLSENFSLSGEAGLGLGFGEVKEIENSVATTTALHMTYYF